MSGPQYFPGPVPVLFLASALPSLLLPDLIGQAPDRALVGLGCVLRWTGVLATFDLVKGTFARHAGFGFTSRDWS